MTAANPPLRVLFDTNAYDAIINAGDEDRIEAASAAGRLAAIVTDVQEDEIRQIRNRRRQKRLLSLFHRIGSQRVDPAEVIGSDITHMARDEILARVAEACCDVLVTNDRALAERCAKAVGYAAFSKDALET